LLALGNQDFKNKLAQFAEKIPDSLHAEHRTAARPLGTVDTPPQRSSIRKGQCGMKSAGTGWGQSNRCIGGFAMGSIERFDERAY